MLSHRNHHMPSSRLELVREIKRISRLIQAEYARPSGWGHSYRRVHFFRLHKAVLQKELENLIA